MSSLNYYLGKVCTVMVSPTSLPMENYTDKQAMLQFAGIVDLVDARGIQITNLVYKTKNFFFFPHIIAILEEQILDANDPQVEVIKEAQKLQEKPVEEPKVAEEPKAQSNGFVDLAALTQMAQQAKS